MHSSTNPFLSIHTHGMVRVAVCTPPVAVADPRANVDATLVLAREGHAAGADLMLFPELGVSAYAIDDLLLQESLLCAVDEELRRLKEETASLTPLLIVGAPLQREGRLYNCAVAISKGRVLGVTPKSFLPNYREYRKELKTCSPIC